MQEPSPDFFIPKKAIFSAEELCEIFGISKKTLTKIRNEGYLKSIPGCRLVRTPYAEVVRYIEATWKDS